MSSTCFTWVAQPNHGLSFTGTSTGKIPGSQHSQQFFSYLHLPPHWLHPHLQSCISVVTLLSLASCMDTQGAPDFQMGQYTCSPYLLDTGGHRSPNRTERRALWIFLDSRSSQSVQATKQNTITWIAYGKRNLLLIVLEDGVQGQGRFCVWWAPTSWSIDSCLLSVSSCGRRGNKALCDLFYRATDSIHDSPSCPNHLPKARSLAHWGEDFDTFEHKHSVHCNSLDFA